MNIKINSRHSLENENRLLHFGAETLGNNSEDTPDPSDLDVEESTERRVEAVHLPEERKPRESGSDENETAGSGSLEDREREADSTEADELLETELSGTEGTEIEAPTTNHFEGMDKQEMLNTVVINIVKKINELFDKILEMFANMTETFRDLFDSGSSEDLASQLGSVERQIEEKNNELSSLSDSERSGEQGIALDMAIAELITRKEELEDQIEEQEEEENIEAEEQEEEDQREEEQQQEEQLKVEQQIENGIEEIERRSDGYGTYDVGEIPSHEPEMLDMDELVFSEEDVTSEDSAVPIEDLQPIEDSFSIGEDEFFSRMMTGYLKIGGITPVDVRADMERFLMHLQFIEGSNDDKKFQESEFLSSFNEMSEELPLLLGLTREVKNINNENIVEYSFGITEGARDIFDQLEIITQLLPEEISDCTDEQIESFKAVAKQAAGFIGLNLERVDVEGDRLIFELILQTGESDSFKKRILDMLESGEFVNNEAIAAAMDIEIEFEHLDDNDTKILISIKDKQPEEV